MSMFALNFTCCILKPLKMPLTNGNRIHQIKMMIWWHPNATQWGDGLASSNLKMMTYEGFMTHVILNIKCWWCWRQMSLKKRLCHDDLAVIVNDAAPCCGFDSNDVKWNISGYLRVQFEWCQVKHEWLPEGSIRMMFLNMSGYLRVQFEWCLITLVVTWGFDSNDVKWNMSDVVFCFLMHSVFFAWK